jgi:DUF4097 and DUF4098 domain-containing protein YvlB
VNNVKRFALAVALVLPTALAAVPAAPAKDGDVRRAGRCTAASTSKIKLSEENGRIEVEFEVDQNVSGDTWRVRIRHGDTVVFRGTETTGGASGSFTTRIVEDDQSGTDVFRAKARNLSTDELCRGTASI